MENGQLLDLLLLGLTWLEEDRGGMVPRRASMVFHTVRYAGVMTERERRGISRNARLISLGMRHMEIVRGPKPRKKAMQELIGTTDKRLVVLGVTETMLDYNRLFGTKGYHLLITETGMAYANSRAAAYPVLSKTKFLESWEPARMQLGRQIKAAKDREGQGGPAAVTSGSSRSGGGGSIPQARLTEEDWEW
ncbi:MAG TPA: hypothetical protein VJM46_04425 [Candidatus Saccharimonadales bacterium]|nr:hypothetical protein [Candidatus Saccharimonadales bacterium]